MKRFSLMLLIAAFVVTLNAIPAYAESAKCEKDEARAKDIVDTAVSAGKFKTLAAALQAADLVETLKGEGPFTVFAPTDKAFGKLPKGTVEELLKPENKQKLIAVLTYHVVPGKVLAEDVVKLSEATTAQGSKVQITAKNGKVRVNNAKVTATDIQASNGVIHVINRVILPPEGEADGAKQQDIVDTAVSAGQFKTLAAALKAAGLIETLKGEGPFTVFAPTDEAFGKLPKGTVEELLKPENKQKLISVLTYHVVPGKVLAKDVVNLTEAKTVQGSKAKITVKDGTVKVNDAKVTATDIQASNGVIHVINRVILPPEKSARTEAVEIIKAAIHKGSHLYNTGHPGACADLYQSTAKRLMAMSPSPLEAGSHENLQSALKHGSGMSCDNSRAWAMRRALESAYAALAH